MRIVKYFQKIYLRIVKKDVSLHHGLQKKNIR